MRARDVFFPLFLPILALLSTAGPGLAQPEWAVRREQAGPGEMPKAPPLFDDLGLYHREITTKSPEAQRYFDQGLRLAYAFNHDEARLAFEQAARLDPNCAICWWGAALTLGPNINLPALPDRARAAWESERKALKLAPKASPVERALVRALATRYANPPPADPEKQKALDTAYADAMREVAKRFPADDDAQTLYAEAMMDLRPWDLWTHDGKPQPGTLEIVATLERVLARNPRHPGANHYYVHAVEASPHPERALAAAKRLESAMPGAGHLVHMPSHIYIRTGRYAEASEANRRAIASDRKYLEAAKPRGFYLMYAAHNHQFLWATTMMEGRSAESLQAARDTAAAVPLEMLRQMPGFDIVLTCPPLALVRFGKWEEVLGEPAPPGDFPYASGMWHYARGVALARLGRLEEARGEKEKLDAALAKTPADSKEILNAAVSLLSVASSVLRGRIAAAEGKGGEAIRLLREAVAAEDRLLYDEPPDWYYPVRQSLGAALLAAGRPAEAEAVYREDLERNPNNGWSLFGLAQSLRAQGKNEDAARAQSRFRSAWKAADLELAASEF